MSAAKCETGWGDSASACALSKARDCHPTPPLLSVASTLPLQGRVKRSPAQATNPYNGAALSPRALVSLENSDAATITSAIRPITSVQMALISGFTPSRTSE